MPVKSRDRVFLNSMYAFIEGEIESKGYPPSVREMIEAGFASSCSVIGYYIATMEKRGMLHRAPGVARGIRLEPREQWEEVGHAN